MNHQICMQLTLFQELKSLTKNISRYSDVCWFTIFSSCPAANHVDRTYLSHLKSGRRKLSHKYIKHYANPESFQAPVRLYNDLKGAMEIIYNVPSDCLKMIELLVDFIHVYIDPTDHDTLMPVNIPSIPTIHDAVTVWTKVVWYCLCHDIAGR